MTWPFDSVGCFAYAAHGHRLDDDLKRRPAPRRQSLLRYLLRSNNASLVVVGDFKPLELRRYVNQYSARSRATPRRRP